MIRPRLLAALAVLMSTMACSSGSGGGIRPPAVPGGAPASAPSAAGSLYEAGQYDDVLGRVGDGSNDAEALWLAAYSHLRLGQRGEAQQRLQRLRDVSPTPGWRATAELALAQATDDEAAVAAGRDGARSFADDAHVQFELGRAEVRRKDFNAAAQAFDRCAELNPRFAYAYYFAGIAYDRINRADLAVIRFEMFQRLAPQAPERPEVEALLRSVRPR